MTISAEEPPQWLPDGWTMEVHTSKRGIRHKSYISPTSRRTFRSRPEVMRYLNFEQVGEAPEGSSKVGDGMQHVHSEFHYSPDGLPHGWIKEIRFSNTTHNKRGVRKDAYYIAPDSRYVFRSLKDAIHYVETNELVKCRGRRRSRDMPILENEASLPMPPKKLKSQEDACSDGVISDKLHIEEQALEDPQRTENIAKQAALGEQPVVEKPTDDSPDLLLSLSFEEFWPVECDALASQCPTGDIPPLDDNWSVEDDIQEQLVSSWCSTPNNLAPLPSYSTINQDKPNN